MASEQNFQRAEGAEQWYDGDVRSSRLAQALHGARQAQISGGPALYNAASELDDIGHPAVYSGIAAGEAGRLRELSRWLAGWTRKPSAAPGESTPAVSAMPKGG